MPQHDGWQQIAVESAQDWSMMVAWTKRAGWIAATVLLMMATVNAPACAAPDAELYEPIAATLRESVRDQTQDRLSTYRIDADLNASTGTIMATESIDFRNETGVSLDDVAFRLYPNAYYYDEGSLTLADVRIDDLAATWQSQVDQTAALISLPMALADGDAVRIELSFTTVVPADSTGSYGIFDHKTATSTWILSDWYPIIAGWEPATGWSLDQPTDLGDPTYSDAALYDVTLRLPANLTIVSTGDETRQSTSGETASWRLVSGPAREFTMVLDDDFGVTSTTVDGITINGYLTGGSDSEAGMAVALQTAGAALAAYSELYGPYPYSELDVIDAPIDRALGISWSGMVFLNRTALLSNDVFTVNDPSRLDFVVAHEVGHQWWGGMIGSNSNEHTFIVEGLTNYTAVTYVEQSQGVDAARQQIEAQLAQPYLAALNAYGDGVVDVPAVTERSGPPRVSLDYGKAALGFLAIRRQIGDAAYFKALRAYASTFAWKNSSPADLLGAFETASGSDISTVWETWFESATTTPEDVEALVAE